MDISVIVIAALVKQSEKFFNVFGMWAIVIYEIFIFKLSEIRAFATPGIFGPYDITQHP